MGLNISFLGFGKQHFGTFLLTNVSSMKGYNEVYGPISNFCRSIATVVLCTPTERAVVKNGQVVPATIMNVMITFDHRFLDGAGGTKMSQKIMEVWQNPAKFF